MRGALIWFCVPSLLPHTQDGSGARVLREILAELPASMLTEVWQGSREFGQMRAACKCN